VPSGWFNVVGVVGIIASALVAGRPSCCPSGVP
jgi:hypothetical protein